jgi:hypothetical protein
VDDRAWNNSDKLLILLASIMAPALLWREGMKNQLIGVSLLLALTSSTPARAYFPEPFILGGLLYELGSIASESFRESSIRKALPHALVVVNESEALEIIQEKLDRQDQKLRERAHALVIQGRHDHNRWANYIRDRNEKKKGSWIDRPISEDRLPKTVDVSAPVTDEEIQKTIPYASLTLHDDELRRIRDSRLAPPAIASRELSQARARMISLYEGEYYSIAALTGLNLVFLRIGSPMLYDERETAAAIVYLNDLERQIREKKLLERKAKKGE